MKKFPPPYVARYLPPYEEPNKEWVWVLWAVIVFTLVAGISQ